MWKMHAALAGMFFGASAASTPSAAAERAVYAEPAELSAEGLSHLLTASVRGSYGRVITPDKARGLANMAAFELSSRLHLFRPVSYCLGFDGTIGGSEGGLVYGATAFVLGLGVRWGNGNVISLCGGAGFDGVGLTTLAVVARFPAELSAGLSIGPIRPKLWVRPLWLLGREARRHGSDLDFLDELELGLSIRIARQHRYWAHMSAGGGPVIGVTYRQFMRTAVVGGFIGIDFGGER